jgi:hypothetical protein
MARRADSSGTARHGRKGDPRLAELRRRVETLEREIQALEQRLTDLAAALSDPQLYADSGRVRAVTAEQRETQERIAWLMREWEALASKASEHE